MRVCCVKINPSPVLVKKVISALPSQAAPMMALPADVARTPSLPAREVTLSKANALQALRADEAQREYRAERALVHAVYGAHPYGRTMPTAAAIESATVDLLHAEHAKRFRPERALPVITGRIGQADALKPAAGAALTKFLAGCKRSGADLVGPDEMRMRKRYLAGSYLPSNQMQRAVAATLARNWLVGLPAEFLDQYVTLIEKVTPEQVHAVSKKYFAPQNQSVVVEGDARAFGEFTVVDK